MFTCNYSITVYVLANKVVYTSKFTSVYMSVYIYAGTPYGPCAPFVQFLYYYQGFWAIFDQLRSCAVQFLYI